MKKILIVCILLIGAIRMYSCELRDSIYSSLYQFMLQDSVICTGQITGLYDNNALIKSYVWVMDALDPYNVNIDIGKGKDVEVYMFGPTTLSDTFYFLVKDKNTYDIFRNYDIPQILSKLIDIQRKNPKKLPDTLLMKYIKTVQRGDWGVIRRKKIGIMYYNIPKEH